MKNILITGGRTFICLDLLRLFKKQKHKIFLAESHKFHISSLSNTYEKKYHLPSPRFHEDKYIKSLIKIIKQDSIDLLLPLYEEILYISRHLEEFPAHCKIFCPSFEILDELHHKYKFMEKLKQLNITHPKTYLLNSQKDIENLPLIYPIIIKTCYSRASQSVKTINSIEELNNLKFNQNNPYIAQEIIKGKKYCSYSICKNGKITAHALYPVSFTVEGNSCITFEETENKNIFDWIEHFAKTQNFSGQFAFDFIETTNGTIYPIECNPRATSGIHLLYSNDQLVDAFLENNVSLVKPLSHTKRQLGCAMVIYGWRSFAIKDFFINLFKTQDIIFHKKDLKPFIFQPFLFIYYYFKSLYMKMNFSSMFLHDIEWNGDIE